MAFGFSTLLGWFKVEKKRHNTAEAFALSRPLTRDEFLRVYENMPDTARANLFQSLGDAQKKKLLALLTPAAAEIEVEEASLWHAEDFLPEKDERKIRRLRQVAEFQELKKSFAAIEEYDVYDLAEILSAESASLAGMVLLQLDKKYASRVLKLLPELRRGEIIKAMATERQIVGEALVAVAKKISAKLAQLPHEQLPKIDGIKHVNDILKLMGAHEADRITREVSSFDAKLAVTLEEERYQFEDLSRLAAKDFRALFSSLPDEVLWARALKAVDQGLRKAMLSKLPIKRAGRIATAMSELATTRLDSIDKARGKILAQALKLATQNEIIIKTYPGREFH